MGSSRLPPGYGDGDGECGLVVANRLAVSQGSPRHASHPLQPPPFQSRCRRLRLRLSLLSPGSRPLEAQGRIPLTITRRRTLTSPLIFSSDPVQVKDRKREILRLLEELKLLQDGARGEELEPPVASCRCHFFDSCGDLQPAPDGDSGEHWVDEVLRRRFLRLGTVLASLHWLFEFLLLPFPVEFFRYALL
ncbi:hypothetical protein ABZP36_024852 [Zizania latifolia]